MGKSGAPGVRGATLGKAPASGLAGGGTAKRTEKGSRLHFPRVPPFANEPLPGPALPRFVLSPAGRSERPRLRLGFFLPSLLSRPGLLLPPHDLSLLSLFPFLLASLWPTPPRRLRSRDRRDKAAKVRSPQPRGGGLRAGGF